MQSNSKPAEVPDKATILITRLLESLNDEDPIIRFAAVCMYAKIVYGVRPMIVASGAIQ